MAATPDHAPSPALGSTEKAPKLALRWSDKMERAFIDALKQNQVSPQKHAPSGFTKEAYQNVAKIISEISVQPQLCDEHRMKNKLGSLKNDWRSWINLLNTGWDVLPNGCPYAAYHVMEEYYQNTDPNARKFRTVPMRFFAELTDLFDPNREVCMEVPAEDAVQDAQESMEANAHQPQSQTRIIVPRKQAYVPPTPRAQMQPSSTEPLLSASSIPGQYQWQVPPPADFVPVPTPPSLRQLIGETPPDSSATSQKRTADGFGHDQRKRFAMSDKTNSNDTSEVMESSTGYNPATSKLHPVAAATILFTKDFKMLPVKAKARVLEKFVDENTAHIFLNTDADVRDALVASWVGLDWNSSDG